jgi:putative addiction module component (TIGR02574 family)
MAERDQILEQALALPIADRVFLVSALAESLPSSEIDDDLPREDVLSGAEFLAELQRRSAAYRAGTTTSRPAAEVIAELRRQACEGRS